MVATPRGKLVGRRFMAMTLGPDGVMPGRGDRGHRVVFGVRSVLRGIPEPRRRPGEPPTGQSLPRQCAGARVGDSAPPRRRPGDAPASPMCADVSVCGQAIETYVFLASFFV